MSKALKILMCIVAFIASFVNGWAACLSTNMVSIILYSIACGIWFVNSLFHLFFAIKE